MFAKSLMTVGFAAGVLGFDLDKLPASERVHSLPDVGSLENKDFRMYSGYVDINEADGKALHYVLVTSKRDAANDPLQVWFNGGPGCSSMMGVFQEHGPYVVEDGETFLHENTWSWNNQANVLYIEMPAGVGYSTCADNCTFSDESTAEDNLTGIRAWFAKYGEFKQHDLFVSGESYGGIYVPTFAQQLAKANDAATEQEFNLKGFIVGNGVTNYKYDTTPAFFKMAFWHGLYDYETYLEAEENDCDFSADTVSDACYAIFERFSELTTDINVYDVYRKCWKQSMGMDLYSADNFGMAKVGNEIKTYKKYYTSQDYTPWLYEGKQGERNLKLLPPCVYGGWVIDYLNNAETRSALHIPASVQAWTYCTDSWNWSYNRGAEASFDVYKWFHEHHPEVEIMVYSGNTDGSVPTWGTQQWINALGWNQTQEWTARKFEGQVAGYDQQHEQLTFRSIHGCGHMAPMWKRGQTWHAVYDWQNKVLAK